MYASTSTAYRSPKKYSKHSGSEVPTAVKSYYGSASPSNINLSRSLRSPTRIGSQLRQVKDSINSIIDSVAEKRQNANYAVEKVKDVNSEALGIFGEGDGMKTPKQNKNYYDEYSSPSNREFHSYSALDGGVFSPSRKYQSTDIESENMELKRELNNKIRQNNEMMKEIAFLRNENQGLKMRSPSKQNREIPAYILEELEALKRENEDLRQSTIRILKKNKYY